METKKTPNFPARLACALMLTISLLGLAGPASSDYRQMTGEVAQFHAFMRKHPSVSTDLQANPQLVNDRKYLDKHEEVRNFLRQHPAVRQEIAHNPRRVFGRYYIDDRREYSDNRPEHRWDYRYDEHRNDRERRNNRDNREHWANHDRNSHAKQNHNR